MRAFKVTFPTGIKAVITPISYWFLETVRKMAEEAIPSIDPEPYKRPVEGAAYEQYYPATNDPEYNAKMQEVEDKRARFRAMKVLDAALRFENETRESLIEQFKEHIANQRAVIELPADEWEATLLYGVMGGQRSFMDALNLATYNKPLTTEEVAEGRATFQVQI